MITYPDPFRRVAADTYRDGDRYVLALELPGVDPTSIDVDVDGQLLTVSAERPAPTGDGLNWISRERWTGTVARRFTLGRRLDTSAITAAYDNGVLRVEVPVSEATKPRKVEVATGSAQLPSPVQEQAVAA